METINLFNYPSFSTKIAISSFAIGTSIFFLHLIIPSEDSVLILGLFFVVFAFVFNGVVLLNRVYKLLTENQNREQTLIQILILLANIPIASLYLYLVINEKSLYSNF